MCYVQCIFKDEEFISAVILWVETCMWTERRVLCCGRRGWIIWLGTTRSIAVQRSGEGNSSSSWCPATTPMLLQGALETPLAGPITGATRRGCEHLSEELLTPMTLRSPPGLLFPRPLRDLQWLNLLLWTLSMASTRPIIWEINAVSVSCSQKAEKDKSGSGDTIYGCVQFNVVPYIDCFITHLFCVRILFLIFMLFSCFWILFNKVTKSFLLGFFYISLQVRYFLEFISFVLFCFNIFIFLFFFEGM